MTSGLDGSFKIEGVPVGTHTIHFNFIGYGRKTQTVTVSSDDDVINLTASLESKSQELGPVTVEAQLNRETDLAARFDEQNADNIKNIVSSKTIEASPDITVANVTQRVSGVALERSATGDGQHAIVRGMDKRYNYTLVNGIKIPSPDNDNRYVPLDIFPADLLERLEVTKSLTPDMEGDAIGGVVDMKLKNAPEEPMLNVNVGSGFNSMFFNQDFMSFDRSNVNLKSPQMINGEDYRATSDDFPIESANHTVESSMPLNQLYNISAGRRFGERKKFGVIVAATHQNTVRGSESDFFHFTSDRESNLPVMTSVIRSNRSTRQKRTGAHVKMDYRLNKNNNLSFYSSYMRLSEQETRTMVDTALQLARSRPGTGRVEEWRRTRQRISNIYTNNLSGEHRLRDNLSVDWTAAYSYATYDDPDMAEFMTISERRRDESFESGFRQSDPVFDNTNHRGFFRRWRGNTDRDYAGYVNVAYTPEVFGQKILIKTGGMHRIKGRENYFDRYRLGTSPAYQIFEGDITDNTFNVPVNGTPNHALNYELSENVTGAYAMTKFMLFKNLQVLTGARLEMTEMSWVTRAPEGTPGRVGEISYNELLPHLHLKYILNSKQNLRASYYESLSRQGYFEIIPYNFYEEDQYREAGNPDLQHAYARNFDLRYEFFPRPLEQIMVGVFYKQIDNPIETAVVAREDLGGRLFLSPQNFGIANNMGVELDYIKYFNKFGIRANYTFTHSEIVTDKIVQFRDESGSLTNRLEEQARPLQGQSAHLGNLSLLYKNQKWGTNAQLSAVYTGSRIAFISAYKDNDQWQRAVTQLDFSLDQKITKGIVAYVKVNNILNAPFELEIRQPNTAAAASEPHLQPDEDRVLSRRDFFHRTVFLGIRFSLGQYLSDK